MSGDLVNHPVHYNSHPSGIETVDVNEWFSGNVAAAIKYVWRKNHKEPIPLRDLQKAEWYLKREKQRLAEAGLVATYLLPMSRAAQERLTDRIHRVGEHDGGGLLSAVLFALMSPAESATVAVGLALSIVRSAVADAEKEKGA